MTTKIPMELMRTFTAIADSGSFSQAADLVCHESKLTLDKLIVPISMYVWRLHMTT